MTAVEIVGPSWSGGDSGRYAGRYPLAVERHALAQVDRLLPGITSVTPHSRYYSLHALIAAEAGRRQLVASDALDLLRRAEVVMAGISLTHADPHPGFAVPHGGDVLRERLASGNLDVATLSQPGEYAQSNSGFWGPYVASEMALGLVEVVDGAPRPGDDLSEAEVREGLGDILALAREDRLTAGELAAYQHLCMCRGADTADGEMLRRRLLPADVREMHREDRRSQTLWMLLRLIELSPGVRDPARELPPFLLYAPEIADDPVVRGLDAYPAWVGVALRDQTVAAWRDLWAWLVGEIDGFMPVRLLGEVLADALPEATVRDFRDSLPPVVGESGRLLPAELHESILRADIPARALATLFLGAGRATTLDERTAAYFESQVDERMQQLTPSWLKERIEAWEHRSLRDFAIDLTDQMVARSQRVALAKARFDRATGTYRIPTRVFVRDGSIRRDSREGGGGVSLRWHTATTVLAGVGLLEYGSGRWTVTAQGRASA